MNNILLRPQKKKKTSRYKWINVMNGPAYLGVITCLEQKNKFGIKTAVVVPLKHKT